MSREVASLAKALSDVNVSVLDWRVNRHCRIKIRYNETGAIGNITISQSPSDINVQRQRERQIRHELVRLGVLESGKFCWRRL